MTSRYSIAIQWSTEDACYVVFLPDFAAVVNQPCTHGATYEEALKHGQEVIESLIDWLQEEGKPVPEPRVFPQMPLEVA